MKPIIIALSLASVVTLAVFSCDQMSNSGTSTAASAPGSTDVIAASTKGKSKLNCFTDDHLTRLSFNNRGDGSVRFERYSPQSLQDVSESFVNRVGGGGENPQSTEFALSNGIEGSVTVLASGVCTDPKSGERYQMSLKISNWGDAANAGYSKAGCCRVIAE